MIHIRGERYRSTDGGASWELTDTVENSSFRSLAFVNGRVGWVGTLGGSERVLFETRDGGLTLTNVSDRIAGDLPSGICGLFVLDEEAVCGLGRIVGAPLRPHPR